jgi:LysM repeat protein
MKYKALFFLFAIGISLGSFAQNQKRNTPLEYINQFKDIAMDEMRTHKIPASITLAQGCLESSYGNSRLSSQGNNHFGIKCKKSWTGKVMYEDDDAVGECFRAYDNAASSYRDHSLFLHNNQRYAFLFQLSITDYEGWAHGLRKAGYATNPRYPQMLIDMVKKYNLAKYDTLVLGLFKSSEKINGILATRLKSDQTLAQIAAVNERTENRIRKLNDLKKGQQIEPGDIVYLRRKKRKATETYHEVIAGQSLWQISQDNGIKLKRLYKLNHLNEEDEVAAGQLLNLRHKADQAAKLKGKQNLIDQIIANENKINYQGKTKPHIVLSNETLYGIAKKYKTSVDTLMAINQLSTPVISLGQTLLVPDNGGRVIEKGDIALPLYHIVLKGETLYSISRKYGVSVESILQFNNLTSNEISVGSKLRVK